MKIGLKSLYHILDKIQIASLHASGVSELRKLTDILGGDVLYIQNADQELQINSIEDLQQLINKYDASIQIDNYYK